MKKNVLTAIIVLAAFYSNATTRYVMPVATGLGNGSSWGNASADLQGMIDSSAFGDTIWVAAGVYKPTTDIHGNASPTDPRSLTFFLKSGLTMFGSFAGTESAAAQRTIAVISNNPTMLSGDIGVVNDSSDNCYHVVFAGYDSATVLDGFTIAHGNANGAGFDFTNSTSVSQSWGGGITAAYSPLTLRNIIFISNYTASLGGGMFSTNSSLNISDCVFAYNNSFDQGGGWDNQFLSHSIVSNCVFYGNKATTGGGILNEINAVLEVYNSTFAGDTASSAGGGISADSSTLINCIVYGNSPGPNITRASYSIIEGTTVFAGTGNSNANPRFVNAALPAGADNTWRTSDDGLQILPCSPAVDMGTDTGAPAQDILGNNRYHVPGVGFSDMDMGAYENLANLTIAAFEVAGDTLTADSSGSTYQWLVCPAHTAAPGNSTGQTYFAATNGEYALVITEGECSDTSACVQIGPSGIAGVAGGGDGFRIYPNPATDYIRVESATGNNNWLSIYDVLGNLLYHQKTVTGAMVDISYLPSGAYYVRAGEEVNRLVVVK
jgi:hypothetical protein